MKVPVALSIVWEDGTTGQREVKSLDLTNNVEIDAEVMLLELTGRERIIVTIEQDSSSAKFLKTMKDILK